jgi:hypothetical protein
MLRRRVRAVAPPCSQEDTMPQPAKALSRDDFTRAHALHIANHPDEIVEAA